MTNKKKIQKNNDNGGVGNTTQTLSSDNLNSVSSVLKIILAAFNGPIKPIAPLPPPLIITGGVLRPGLSTDAIAARIISRQSEAGLIAGNVFGDGPNGNEAMDLIRIEEIVNALQTEAVVNVAIAPGVQVTTIGVGNLGAPVLSQGATTTIASGNGIIR
jgi:hypothetical protein